MSATTDPRTRRRLVDMRAVYRMFDADSNLLYVGQTAHPAQRFSQHAEKRWFLLVTTITLEWHDTHAQAVLAERDAIAAERPRYNVSGTPRARRRPAAPALEENPLSDVLAIFRPGETKLYWRTITTRLTLRFPERWATTTPKAVSMQIRALGVPGVVLREPGQGTANGCRREDVEIARAGIRVSAA